MEEEFSFGVVNPTDVVIDGEIGSPEVQAAIAELQITLENQDGVSVFPFPVVNEAGDLGNL